MESFLSFGSPLFFLLFPVGETEVVSGAGRGVPPSRQLPAVHVAGLSGGPGHRRSVSRRRPR